jgi:hypothetical protein
MKTMIYQNLKGEKHLYQIEDPNPEELFGNKKEKLNEKGFRVKCANRNNEWRSFRYDGVIAIT